MRLTELQRSFQTHLLLGDDAILESVVDAPPLTPAARVKIYRNAYRVRLLDALQDAYPVLFKVLGDEMFEHLGAAFIEAHPSVHRSIRWYGRELGGFLAQRPPYAEQPILAEIARFEWTLSEVFDAADAAPVGREALQAVDPDSWDQLGFVFHPSLRLLDLAWNTVPVWQAMSGDRVPSGDCAPGGDCAPDGDRASGGDCAPDGDRPSGDVDPPQPEMAETPVTWLLWRRDLMNRFRSLDVVEKAALETALSGQRFGELCAALGRWLPEEEIPLRAATLIGTWTDSGIITGIHM